MGTHYTKEFREEAVKLVLESQSSVKQIAKDLGVNTWTLRGWVKAHREKAGASEPRGSETLEEENRRIKRELCVLRQERDLLKKRRRTSRKSSCEVRLHGCSYRRVSYEAYVPCAGSLKERLLRLADTA